MEGTKVCTKCHQEQSLEDFQKHKSRPDGLQCWCKACFRTFHRNYAKTHKDEKRRRAAAYRTTKSGQVSNLLAVEKYKIHNPEKKAAHYILRQAIRHGRIVKPTVCSKCGNVAKIEGHHEDYDKPLEVVWVCTQCHNNIHT